MDTRLGGDVRYRLVAEGENLMRIPDEMRKCVCFVGYRDRAGTMRYAGTAFFLARQIDADEHVVYCFTAAHVLEGIAKKGAANVSLRVNRIWADSIWIDVPLNQCEIHPDPTVDIALIDGGTQILSHTDHLALSVLDVLTPQQMTEHAIGPGSDVFVTGLFSQYRKTARVVPIIRVGNVAAMPGEPIETTRGFSDMYLIEARSIGGLSGSPVLVHRGQFIHDKDGGLTFHEKPPHHLIGVIQGHFDTTTIEDGLTEDESSEVRHVNMGIALVTPISKVLEMVNDPKRIEREQQQVQEAQNKKGRPVEDALDDEEEPPFTKEQFEDALRKVSQKLPDAGKSET